MVQDFVHPHYDRRFDTDLEHLPGKWNHKMEDRVPLLHF